MIALFVGRFQPLHKGHVKVLRQLLKEYRRVVVAIGSISQGRSRSNPFTFRERKQMFKIIFSKEVASGRVVLVGIRDYFDDEKWSSALMKRVRFDVVVTGNKWTERCFKGKKKIIRIKHYNRNVWMGRKIRAWMASGNPEWKKVVDGRVVNYLERVIVKDWFMGLKVD